MTGITFNCHGQELALCVTFFHTSYFLYSFAFVSFLSSLSDMMDVQKDLQKIHGKEISWKKSMHGFQNVTPNWTYLSILFSHDLFEEIS